MTAKEKAKCNWRSGSHFVIDESIFCSAGIVDRKVDDLSSFLRALQCLTPWYEKCLWPKE